MNIIELRKRNSNYINKDELEKKINFKIIINRVNF